MLQVLLWLIAAAGLGLLAIAVGMRLVPSAVDEWHVDPGAIEAVDLRNAHQLSVEEAPVYALSAPELARELDAVALATPGSSRIAGDATDLWMTYVVHSRIMGFPDYVSVRIMPRNGDHATLAIYARARFGTSDLGVNRARNDNWLAALRRFER